MTDHLQQQWACLTCNAKFPAGEIVIRAGQLAYDPWPCPKCGCYTILPADKATRETAEYYGEIGTMN